MSGAVTDGRLLRGARSRRAIARRAVDLASLDGLDGLSLGRLAADLGLSKSGVQTLFGTKENLQLAAVEAAAEAFEEAVTRPALAQPPGEQRVRALIDRWIAYVDEPLFPGGCFWAANLPIFDSRPGRVRDRLASQQRAWRGLLADELERGAENGDIVIRDPNRTAFQIDAVLIAANNALRLGDNGAVDTVRHVIDGLLAPPR
jgi:AcrR family transcriptional regulator